MPWRCLLVLFPLLNSLSVASGLAQDNPLGISLIVVQSLEEAEDIRLSLEQGAWFGALARQRSVDPTADLEGYQGQLPPSAMRPQLRALLEGVDALGFSPIVPIGEGYLLLKALTPEEVRWLEAYQFGELALTQGQLAAASESFGIALSAAKTFGPDDPRVGESLTGLADVHMSRGEQAPAAALYQHALGILRRDVTTGAVRVATLLDKLAEAHMRLGNLPTAAILLDEAVSLIETDLRGDHRGVAYALSRLGHVLRLQRRFEEAGTALAESSAILDSEAASNDPLLRDVLDELAQVRRALGRHSEARDLTLRALVIRWSPGTRDSGQRLLALFDRFAYVLDLAISDRNPTLLESVAAFEREISDAEVQEDLYLSMSAILGNVGLKEEAVSLLARGVVRFPDSVRVRHRLGIARADAGGLRRGLEDLRAALGLATDSGQLGVIYASIGQIAAQLFRFDEAEDAVRSGLELQPGSAPLRSALADILLRTNRIEAAITQYRQLDDSHPNIVARTRMAQAFLRAGQLEDAAAAAGNALRIDPTNLEAHYYLGRALIRMGRVREGQVQLEEFARARSLDQEERDSKRATLVTSKRARKAYLKGMHAKAFRILQEAISSHPEVGEFYYNLALLQHRDGRPADVVATLDRMLENTTGNQFLAHRQLALAHRLLGNGPAVAEHEARYLEQLAIVLDAKAR